MRPAATRTRSVLPPVSGSVPELPLLVLFEATEGAAVVGATVVGAAMTWVAVVGGAVVGAVATGSGSTQEKTIDGYTLFGDAPSPW